MLVLCGGMSSTFSVSFLLCCFVSVLLSLSSTILRNNIFACPRVRCAKKCFGHGSSHFTTNRHLAAAAAAAASAAAAAAAAAAATAAASVVVAVFYCCCGLPLQSPYIRKLAWSAAAAAAAACAVLDIFLCYVCIADQSTGVAVEVCLAYPPSALCCAVAGASRERPAALAAASAAAFGQ